jgi:hypothetical protein
MGGACSIHGRGEKCIQNLVREPEGNITLGRSRHRTLDNTKYIGVRVWIELIWFRIGTSDGLL